MSLFYHAPFHKIIPAEPAKCREIDGEVRYGLTRTHHNVECVVELRNFEGSPRSQTNLKRYSSPYLRTVGPVNNPLKSDLPDFLNRHGLESC